MDRVVVVGSGVLGASVAYHLARSGADVVVMEAERPASGASGATLSLDVTHLQAPYSYYRLNRAGSEGTSASPRKSVVPRGGTQRP